MHKRAIRLGESYGLNMQNIAYCEIW